jgi:propanediol dehydratase large subunit
MNDFLSHISNARLKDDPLAVALAVDAVLKLFDELEVTVRQSAESDRRIEAPRSG